MEIVINTTLTLPVYAQLIEQIKKAILNGELNPGSALPSIRQLANDLELNHSTVAKAYRLLAQDAVIQTEGYGGNIIDLQKIGWFEAGKLVFNYEIVDRTFHQDKKAMRFGFTLNNGQFLIVLYDHETKEKSYFIIGEQN